MAFYQTRGRIPRKKHVTFYKEDKKSLHMEELTSSLGFDGIYSTKYHLYAPTRVEEAKEVEGQSIPHWQKAPLLCYHFCTEEIENPGNFYSARSVLMFNDHVAVSTALLTENSDVFFRNGFAHEMIFLHRGKGTCRSEYGILDLREGVHLVVPKGTIYQLRFDDPKDVKLFIVESSTPFEIPKKYRNDYGQLLEHAPYSERDFIAPGYADPVDERGKFPLLIKTGERLFEYTMDHHPFDVTGWDGFLYPFTFNIEEFSPIVGKLHQPPPVHALFITSHFVVCNFTPRLFDFHPEAIPAPYFHANVDSDEILYYVKGDFMSRKGVSDGSITLHPMAHLHGPQPGKYEASVGKKETGEYALMVDTFAPLKLTRHARDCRVENYYKSWIQEG